MSNQPTISEQVVREAESYLQNLFQGAKPVVEGNKQQFSVPTIIRPTPADPTAPRGRSPFIIEKYGTGSDTKYNIRSSGVAAWKIIGICEVMRQVTGTAPKISAIDEMGNAVDASDPAQHKNMARLFAEFPDGTSINWTVVTGIGIHCPSQAVFDQLAGRFTASGKGAQI